MLDRLCKYWVYGGALAGVLILALTPALASVWSLPLIAVFLQLPIYMLHQYEEHDNDRFRQFFNTVMFGGRQVLSPAAVFVINVPGVWGVNLVAFYLAWRVDLGLGLIAVYLTLFNALIHVISAVALRRYNPGMVTAVGVFFPVGAYALYQINRAGAGQLPMQAIGLGVAIGIHAAIIGYARHKSAAIGRVARATGA